MGKIPIQFTLHQFNLEVDKGNILEDDVSGPSQSIRIYCTTPINLYGDLCKTHLRDLWVIRSGKEDFVKVGCGVCQFEGYRKLGKQTYVNGGA